MKKMTKGRLVFQIINYTVLILLSALCLFPLLNILAMSFSSATAVAAGKVSVLPVEFNTYAYSYVRLLYTSASPRHRPKTRLPFFALKKK